MTTETVPVIISALGLEQNLGKIPEASNINELQLRTVNTIVIAHTFCTSPDTRISYQ